MAKRQQELKDLHVKNLKPAPEGKRIDVPDTEVRGLLVRVTEKGTKTFTLYTRYPGHTKPTRRSLGEYGELTLVEARVKARKWKEMIAGGIDPQAEEEKARAAQQQKRDRTFAAVADDFIRDKLPGERRRESVMRELSQLIEAWGSVPIAEITEDQVRSLIMAKKRLGKRGKPAPVQARNLLSLAKRFFAWAVDQRVYGMTVSPCRDLKAKKIIGRAVVGQRTLSPDELRALWRAAGRLPYPHRAVYHLLMLTALRLNEAADASWPEFDLREGLWTIPGARMKGTNDKPRPHALPLTDDIKAVLDALPKVKGAVYLFSADDGASPVWMGDKIKKKVDALMLEELRSMARDRGEDPANVTLPRWVNHDIRRTVRTELSGLRIPEVASEAIMAHVQPGIAATYNKYQYLDEKRIALEAWATRLKLIIDPPAPNVLAFQKATA